MKAIVKKSYLIDGMLGVGIMWGHKKFNIYNEGVFIYCKKSSFQRKRITKLSR
jgi:hypothetical protein